ncbi:MAG: deoxyribose-phosphate aldolase [Bacteroidota bacterium]
MEINKKIDHTLLKPQTSAEEVKQLCRQARDHNLFAVCIPPFFVALARQELLGTDVKVATVIGFPLGYAATMAKVSEITRAIEEGADELDVVISLGALRSGDWNHVSADIDRMVTAVRLRGKVIKVIIETSILKPAELNQLCDICNRVKPDFVKTSTGTLGGATVEIIKELRQRLLPEIKIKASGGIRNAQTAHLMLSAGADRIGTSSGVAIVQGG